jgi:heme/copper-type cytochrome/quinol oxidase subunit 3
MDEPGTTPPERAGEGRIDALGKRTGMWFFLFTEFLFFGGMFLLYSIYRYKFAADFHRAAADENVVLGGLNTGILLTSSLAMALAIAAVRRGRIRRSIWPPSSSSRAPSGRRRSPAAFIPTGRRSSG